MKHSIGYSHSASLYQIIKTRHRVIISIHNLMKGTQTTQKENLEFLQKEGFDLFPVQLERVTGSRTLFFDQNISVIKPCGSQGFGAALSPI